MRKKQKLAFKKSDLLNSQKNDIVQVTDFTVKPVSAKAGEAITIRMEIANVSNKNLKRVPWQIVKDKKILFSGSRFDLPSGNRFSISFTWSAAPGTHFIYGDVDPKNVLREPRTKQFNNSPQGIDVKVF